MAQSIFTGANGEVYYSSLNILAMTLMLLLSVRLLMSRQKWAYLTLTLCMGIMTLGQLVLLGAGLTGGQGRGLTITHDLLNAVSFILGNMGIYQLYGETTRRVSFTVYGLLGGAVLLSFFPIVSDIYAILLVVFVYITVTPLMEGRKHHIGLITYMIAAVSHMINNDLFATRLTVLHVIDNIGRIIFFAILFVILFDKVLSLMETSYNKSTRDTLTGLYNRFYFYTTLSYMISERKPISVLFFDIDNFKKLNDSLGHDEGDRALKAVASILKEEAEETGIAGRYGGEEMVMMLEYPEINLADFAERIRGRIEDETIVTASIGYATYEEDNTSDELIKNADQAMYISKKSGKNRVTSYKEMMLKS